MSQFDIKDPKTNSLNALYNPSNGNTSTLDIALLPPATLLLPPSSQNETQLRPEPNPVSVPKSRDRWVKDCTKAVFELEAKQNGLTVEEYVSEVGAPSSAISETLGRINNDVKAGIISVPAGIAEFAQAFSSSTEVKQIANELRAQQSDLLPSQPTTTDYIIKTGAECATLFIPGVGVSRGLRTAQCISRNLATMGGAVTSAVLESSKHAGEVYQTLVNKGVSTEVATTNAEKVFYSDLVLTSTTNRLGIFGHGGAIPRVAKGSLFEGAQSATQQELHNYYSLEKPLTGTLTAGLIGMFTGGMLQAINVANMIKNFRKRAMPTGIKDIGTKLNLSDNDQYLKQNYEELSKKLNLTPAQKEAFRPTLHKDALTDFGITEYRIPSLERNRTFAKFAGKDVNYGLVDIANLKGLNVYCGRKGADKVFKHITDILQDEVASEIKKLGGTADWFRHGGDEICVVTTGISNKQLENAFANAKLKVDAFIKDEGLSNIIHPKHRNDILKRGVSITYSTTKLDPVLSLGKALNRADTTLEISKQKNTSSVTPSTMQRPDVDRILPLPPSLKEIQSSKQALNSYISDLPSEVRRSNKFLTPDKVSEVVHQDKAMKHKLNADQNKLLSPTILKDPVTKYYTRFDRVQSLHRLIDFVEMNHTDAVVVGYEFRNLTGINQAKGASGANQAFREITNTLENELKKITGNNTIVVAFRNTGPRGEFHVAGANVEQVNEALKIANKQIEHITLQNGWDNIEHPKDPHYTQNGVGLYTSITNIGKDSCAATIYHDMDTQLRNVEIAHQMLGR